MQLHEEEQARARTEQQQQQQRQQQQQQQQPQRRAGRRQTPPPSDPYPHRNVQQRRESVTKLTLLILDNFISSKLFFLEVQ